MRPAGSAWSGPLAFALEVAAAIGLAYVVAGIAWTVVDPASAAGGAALSAAPQRSSAGPAFAYRPETGGLNPFRSGAFDASVETADAADDAPISTLNLKVVGARVSSDAPSAIILTPDNKQGVYRPGDDIVDGVVLERIEAERVLVRRQGAIEALPFGGRELAVIASESSFAAARAAERAGADGTADDDAAEVATATAAGGGGRADGGAREAPVTGVALLNGVAPQPAPEGEDGVALYPRGDGAAFIAAGFQPGDVVKMVNGVMVSDASSLTEMLSDLGRGSPVNVRLERGRETTSLDFVLD